VVAARRTHVVGGGFAAAAVQTRFKVDSEAEMHVVRFAR